LKEIETPGLALNVNKLNENIKVVDAIKKYNEILKSKELAKKNEILKFFEGKIPDVYLG